MKYPNNFTGDSVLQTSDVVFIVGAGRSGTTWLHLMLGAHPKIATGQESQLFQNYLRSLYKQWRRELAYPESESLRKHGITSYLNEEQFVDLLRQFALSVFANVFVVKQGATVFLEKSPNNSFNVDLMYRCFPDAKYIHMIRDGRDVVTSMLAAKKSWGRQWAPTHASDAATQWVEAVSESKRLASMAEHYIEVRYEDLLGGGSIELGRVFQFLGIESSETEFSAIYDKFSFGKLQKDAYSREVFLSPGVANASGTEGLAEPKGFFRKGIAGDWRNSLTDVQSREVHWVAGGLLKSLNYLGNDDLMTRQPMSIRLRQLRSRIKAWVRSVGSKILS